MLLPFRGEPQLTDLPVSPEPFFLDKRPCSSVWLKKKKRFGLGLPCTLLEGGPIYVPLNLPRPKQDPASVAEEPEVAEPALAEGSGAY